jgi:hypothetical protein
MSWKEKKKNNNNKLTLLARFIAINLLRWKNFFGGVSRELQQIYGFNFMQIRAFIILCHMTR